MPARLFKYPQTEPARSILAMTAWVTLLAGLFIFTPWHVALSFAPAASAAFSAPVIIGGIVNTILCIPAIIAVYKNNPSWLARGSFWLFVWYLFITMTRIVLFETATLMWVPTLIVAGVMAVIYIEQQYLSKYGGGRE